MDGSTRHILGVLLLICAALSSPECNERKPEQTNGEVVVRRTIDEAKEMHAGELMSLKGVVGVYVGALDDGRPCIGVMVVKKTALLEARIPATIEGYPVRIDETGEIKPLQ